MSTKDRECLNEALRQCERMTKMYISLQIEIMSLREKADMLAPLKVEVLGLREKLDMLMIRLSPPGMRGRIIDFTPDPKCKIVDLSRARSSKDF